jgi:hypothetical protein
MSKIEEVIAESENLMRRRRKIIGILRKFEAKYGLSTEKFIEMWRSGSIPEPEDSDILADFMSWESAYEVLKMVEEKLERILNVTE